MTLIGVIGLNHENQRPLFIIISINQLCCQLLGIRLCKAIIEL